VATACAAERLRSHAFGMGGAAMTRHRRQMQYAKKRMLSGVGLAPFSGLSAPQSTVRGKLLKFRYRSLPQHVKSGAPHSR
jgi:hypothetical protein